MATGYVSLIEPLPYIVIHIADETPNSWAIIIGFVVIVLASIAAWFFSPKGETQTYVFNLCPTL
jgi:hypothetical protein